MPYAAALSEHPLPTHAVGEVVGQVLEQVGESPDLAVLFVTAPHAGALEDLAATVRATLRPGVLLGAAAVAVIGGPREVEEQPAVSLWAARLGHERAATPVRLTWAADVSEVPVSLDDPGLVVVLADPFTFAIDEFLETMASERPGVEVVGGLASAADRPGGNRLALDGELFDDGAVAVHLSGAVATTIVSQGCRPIGQPFVITDGDRNVIRQLAGQSAMNRLESVVGELGPDDRELVRNGIQIGCVIDEQTEEFGRGDFLIRSVLGGDRDTGAIAIGQEVEVGATVQFQVRDAETADEELRALLAGQTGTGALLFTCNGRGVRLFGLPDHDLGALVDAVVSDHANAGMFCAGELGPVGGQNFVHGFTASVVLFRDR